MGHCITVHHVRIGCVLFPISFLAPLNFVSVVPCQSIQWLMYLSMWATCPSSLYRLSCLIVEQDELEQDTLPTPIFPNLFSLLSMVWTLLQLGSQCEFGHRQMTYMLYRYACDEMSNANSNISFLMNPILTSGALHTCNDQMVVSSLDAHWSFSHPVVWKKL